jgi:hypothetical protein
VSDVSEWVARKLARKCGRRGCPVVLPEGAEHCLCDEHAVSARLRTLHSTRVKRSTKFGPLFTWGYEHRHH